jgi:hypothetical protein
MVEQSIMMINPMTPQRAAILAMLQADKPMRPVDIAAMVGKSRGSVQQMLFVMRTDGQAEQVAYGWRATADGVRALKNAAHLGLDAKCAVLGNHCSTSVSS